MVALFTDGSAYYSPDGTNLNGSGTNVNGTTILIVAKSTVFNWFSAPTRWYTALQNVGMVTWYSYAAWSIPGPTRYWLPLGVL